MSHEPIPLDLIAVASPCTASWDDMRGTDWFRFCPKCELNVYNLSALTCEQAEKLVRQKEGRLCVRFYRRADGTVLTRDCPVGLRAVRRRLAVVSGTAAAAVLTVLVGGLVALDFLWRNKSNKGMLPPSWTKHEPLKTLVKWLDPRPIRGGGGSPGLVMGDVCPPPAQGGPEDGR